MRKLAWLLSISMIFTGMQMPVMANTVADPAPQESVAETGLAGNEAVISANEITEDELTAETVDSNAYEVKLSLAETYYKTEKGYPLAFQISCPQELSSLKVESVELSMDGGAYSSYSVVSQKSVTGYHSIYLGYLTGVTAGEHGISVKVNATNNGMSIVLQGSGKVVYQSDADAAKGSTIVKESPQYFSTKAGMSVQMPGVSDVPVLQEDITINKVEFVHHDTKEIVWQKQYPEGLGEYNQYIYKGKDPRYEAAIQSVLDNDCNVLSASLSNMSWSKDIPTGAYDYVLTDVNGAVYTVENCYYGTNQPYVWGVKDAKDAQNYEESTPSINADNRGSYVSVFVYGINLDKDNVPVFVTGEEQTEISQFDEADIACGYEPSQCGWGVFFATKKTVSDQWDLSNLSVPTASAPGEKTSASYQVKVAGDASEKVYECWIDYSVQYDRISMEDGKRYMLASDWVQPGDKVKLLAKDWWGAEEEQESEQLTVQQDSSGTYVFVSDTTSDFNSIWNSNSCHNVAKSTAAGWQCATTEAKYSYRSYSKTVALKDVLYVTDGYTFQIHPCNEVGNAVVTGVGTGYSKNALSAEELKKLDDGGVYRVVVYRGDGSLYRKDRYCFTSTPIVREYEITYRLDGGTNHRDNPDTFTNVSADIVLKAPSRAGYTFEGWYADPDFVDKIDRISCSTMRSMELFAKWRENTSTDNNNNNSNNNNSSDNTNHNNDGTADNGSNPTDDTEVQIGKTGVDAASKMKYEVTTVTENGGSVTYTGTTQKKGKVKIPKTITIEGKTYKVTAVSKNAFKKNKSITSVVIGDNVTSIGTSAFEGCSKLTSVTIGKNVKTIGKKAFYNCKNLKNITIKTAKLTKKTVGANALKGISKNVSVKVPKKQLQDYKKLLVARGVNKKAKIK